MTENKFYISGVQGSPNNTVNTEIPNSGVIRDVKTDYAEYDYYPTGDVYDIQAEQYRTAVLQNDASKIEYFVWAANTSNLTTLESEIKKDGTILLPKGTHYVIDTLSPRYEGVTPIRPDGTTSLVLVDSSNRSINSIVSIKLVRGDDSTNTQHLLT